VTDDRCNGCGDPVEAALARSIQLRVDGSEVDAQRLCPACFAEWIDRYQREMGTGFGADADERTDIIVD
jgi:hypothetical protein